MSNLVGFSRPDAKRIADVVRHVEGAPLRGVPRTQSTRRSPVTAKPTELVIIEITGRRSGYVAGVNDAREYRCSTYENAISATVKLTNQKAFCVQHAQTETVPTGSKFLSVIQRISNENIYVFEVPRDL